MTGTDGVTAGTPKNLDEAVMIAIQLSAGKGGAAFFTAVVRDLLGQKFGAVHLKAHTEEQRAIVEELWEMITGEKYGSKNEKN